jgi:maltose O-acetyltransferase
MLKGIGRTVRLGLVNGVGSAYWLPKTWRRLLYRACGFQIGSSTIFFSGTIIRTERLSIGSGSFINHSCLFDHGDIRIGDSVFLSAGVTLASGDHEVGPSTQRAGREVARPIVIEDGAWIGTNAVVLGGVTIRRGCIVGAGAVVTKSTDPDCVYVGVPARRMRVLDER